jgi:hypothetical protein
LFGFLEHAEAEIAKDAFSESEISPDHLIGEVGKKLPSEKLRSLLTGPRTPIERLRLYGFLLGNCGNKSDAQLLRTLFEKLGKRDSPYLTDGIISGYVLLEPADGLRLMRKILQDPSEAFLNRYAAWRAVRFFGNTRRDVIREDEILKLARIATAYEDLADLPIQDLRRWRMWGLTDQIFSLYGKKSPEIVQRAVVYYALQCPDARAARFISDLRKDDPEYVKDVEEILEILSKRRPSEERR